MPLYNAVLEGSICGGVRIVKSSKKKHDQVSLRAIYMDHMQMHKEAVKLYTDGLKTEGEVVLVYVEGDFVYSERIVLILKIYSGIICDLSCTSTHGDC